MTASDTHDAIGQRVAGWFPSLADRRRYKQHTDATVFYQVQYGDGLVLKKVYPYIPESLNRILMHFSIGANWFYEHVDQLLEDLGG
jgi:hypothetical protein